jgi:hypothetical protein
MAPPVVAEVVRGLGRPLESPTRTAMERAFGHNFGGVRVHTGALASQAARAVGAVAFTVGQDIAFREGAYAPETPPGRRLLAHELTHVVQQLGSEPATVLQRQPDAPPANAPPAPTSVPAPPASPPKAPATAQTPSGGQDIHARVAAVVQAPDPMEVIRIMDSPDFGSITEPERLSLIRIQNQFGGGDPKRLAQLWEGFGDGRLPEVAAANMPDWETSARLWPGMPDLIAVVGRTERAFVETLGRVAEFNLAQNAAYVQQHLERLGMAAGETKSLSPTEITAYRRNVQGIAYQVWLLLQEQERATHIAVGEGISAGKRVPVTFDPAGPEAAEYPAGVNVAFWKNIKARWDQAQMQISEAAANYPEIYEPVASKNPVALLNLSRAMPEDPTNPPGSSMGAALGRGYEGQAKGLLVSLADRIRKSQGEVGGLDLLDLQPLRERVFAAPGRWHGGFDEWVARRAVNRHTRDEQAMKILADMGFAAAALVAPFASGGMALALAAVAGGAGIARAAIDLAEAGRLETAAKATPLRGTELVTQAQADAKSIEAGAELFAAFVEALLVGGEKALEYFESRLARLLERLVPDAAVRAALSVKVPENSLLIRLLGKADSPADLLAVLATRDARAAEALLDLRRTVRARAAALRARHQPRLDAESAMEKDLQSIEQDLQNPDKVEDAARRLDDIEQRLQDIDVSEGLNPPVLGVIVEEDKFKYLFGKAAPDPHNVPRSEQNQAELARIGFFDDAESRAAIRAHLERVPDDPSNIIARAPGEEEFKPGKFPKYSVFERYWGGPTETRQSLLYGPGGQAILYSTWEVRYGTRRLTSLSVRSAWRKPVQGVP